MNEIINTSDLMMKLSDLFSGNNNKLPSVWKNVVSKIKSYKDENEDSEKRMPIGERLAGNTRVVDLKNGILLVETDHPGWIQYLKIYQKFILKGLNTALPDLKIKSLAFRISGNNAMLNYNYEEDLERNIKKYTEQIEKKEKELEKYNSRKDSSFTDNKGSNAADNGNFSGDDVADKSALEFMKKFDELKSKVSSETK